MKDKKIPKPTLFYDTVPCTAVETRKPSSKCLFKKWMQMFTVETENWKDSKVLKIPVGSTDWATHADTELRVTVNFFYGSNHLLLSRENIRITWTYFPILENVFPKKVCTDHRIRMA